MQRIPEPPSHGGAGHEIEQCVGWPGPREQDEPEQDEATRRQDERGLDTVHRDSDDREGQ